MTDAEIKAARELCEKATPGVWRWDGPFLYSPDSDHGVLEHYGTQHDAGCKWNVSEGDRAFIAAARTLLPRLLDEVERLRGELKTARDCYCDAHHDGAATRTEARLLRAELERMRPVYEAAKAWAASRSTKHWSGHADFCDALADAVDAALAKEPR